MMLLVIKRWLGWLFHGPQVLSLAIEPICQRLAKLEADPVQQGQIECVAGRLEALQHQIDDLRRLVTARESEKEPIPIRARNWREVQNLMGETNG